MAVNGFIEMLDQIAGQRKDVSGQDEWHYCCPLCHEKKFKFYVDGKTRWICYHCGKYGNALTFVEQCYGMNKREARGILRDWGIGFDSNPIFMQEIANGLSPVEAIVNMLGKDTEDETSVQKTGSPLPEGYKYLMDYFLDPESYPFFYYLKSRGVTLEQIEKHHIGYITFGRTRTAKGKIINLRNHIVFLTFDKNGRVVFWNTRSIESGAYIKSFNAPADDQHYSRSDVIFNLNNAVHTGRIIIQEGVFDALTVGESGVATFGKMVTNIQVQLIREAVRENPYLELYVFLDSDAKSRSVKLAEDLRSFSSHVYLVGNNSIDDANKMGHDKCWELINQAYYADPMGILGFIANS